MSLTDFITFYLDLNDLNINKKHYKLCIYKNCNKNANFNYVNYKKLKRKQ